MNDNKIQRRGMMFIFSGPSGGGKSSVIKKILQEVDNIELSVSVTTRSMREGEVEGKDYYFITEDKFRDMVENDDLYEYVNSDFGPKYGTPRGKVDELLSEGKDVILDMDYPGVVQIKKIAGDRVKTISFIPPSIKILRERLTNRKTDSIEVIEKRMSMAEKRIREALFYDYVVVNDELSRAVFEVKTIIESARLERKNLSGLENFIEKVVEEK